LLNNDVPSTPWPSIFAAERRVLDHQLKLHRWARNEPARRFDDVFNLICDRATLLVAWERVSGNRGARTAGVDAVTRYLPEGSMERIYPTEPDKSAPTLPDTTNTTHE